MNRRTLNWLPRAALLGMCLLPACRQKMAEQPSLRPDEATGLFADGEANRPSPPGTVARGHLRTDRLLFSGERPPRPADRAAPVLVVGAQGLDAVTTLVVAATPDRAADRFPFPVTRTVLDHGRNRFSIYCVVCHDPEGNGRGPIVLRGYTPPPSFHIDRLRAAQPGHLFDVITNGYGSMPDYRAQIPPRDRWAIAAYVRALQLSRHYPVADLTAEMRAEWRAQTGGEIPGE